MPKALVILGATASGKSELAMWLARKSQDELGVETQIMAADSMQVYKGMDIGTAKPTVEEQKEIKHYCLDLAEPSEEFSVRRYKEAATQVFDENNSSNENDGNEGAEKVSKEKTGEKIASKTNKAANIIIVGGTGLYIRVVVDDLQIPPQYLEIRKELEQEPNTQKLFEQLKALDELATEEILPNNRRRIIRALEVTFGSGKPFSSFGKGMKDYASNEFCQVGIDMSRETLDRRIETRYEQQMDAGFLDEVKILKETKLSKTARQALGYKELLAHLSAELSLEDALAEAKQRTKRFARRQQRWFRRDPRIKWLEAKEPKDVSSDLFNTYINYFGIK